MNVQAKEIQNNTIHSAEKKTETQAHSASE